MNTKSSYDVVVFAAHPDDAEMGMAGTMIKLVRAGYRVLNIPLTPSQMSTFGDEKSRAEEFKAACAVVGCHGRTLNFLDTGIENTREARIELARIIRETKPKVVFAPYHTNPLGELGGVAHVDHYTTGALVRDAVKMARIEKVIPDLAKHTIQKLYFYLLPSNVRATAWVDVSDVIDDLLRSIRAYKSQMQISFGTNQIEDITLRKRSFAGLAIGTKYAEVFTTDLPLRYEPKHFFEI